MGINCTERFENNTDTSDVTKKADNIEKNDTFSKAHEKEEFEELCESAKDSSSVDWGSDGDDDMEDSFEEQIEKSKEAKQGSQDQVKLKINGIDYKNSQKNYKMDSVNTMYEIGKQMNPQSREFYTKALYSGNNPKVKLIGKGKEFYITGEKASGNFLAKEHPGNTAYERQENLQLPPLNDAETVSKVRSLRAQIVIESTIAAQPDWAEESGYKARQGIKQIYTPNTNPEGAIKDKRYEKCDK